MSTVFIAVPRTALARASFAKLRLILAAVIPAVAGCATPNVQPFAEQTARLAEALSGEHRQIAAKFEQVVDLYGKACESEKRAGRPAESGTCKQHEEREKERAAFDQSRKAIDAVLSRMVVYATTLADLAHAGETGADAAKALGSTLDKFTALAGLGTGLVGEAVIAMATKVGAVVTRVQAQASLATATAAAEPAVAAMAEAVKRMRKADEKILSSLYHDELRAAEALAGRDLLALYESAVSGRTSVNSRLIKHAAALAALKDCGPERPPGSAGITDCDTLRSELRNAEELARLLELLRPEYQAYDQRRAAVSLWRTQRRENFQFIEAAADAWKLEHDRAAEYLRRCGGLRAVQCATLDAATLKTLVDQINQIRSIKE
jgi:hypothetical protein